MKFPKLFSIALFAFLFSTAGRLELFVLEGRSSKWHQLRNQIVAEHPYCAMCGKADSLQVHHKLPYHVRPDLELERTNCCVLCAWCHFHWGHDTDGPTGPDTPSWKKYNKQIDEDIARHGCKQ